VSLTLTDTATDYPPVNPPICTVGKNPKHVKIQNKKENKQSSKPKNV
jgi:hypothetical protein